MRGRAGFYLVFAVMLGVCGLLAAAAVADGPPSLSSIPKPMLSSAISSASTTVNAGQTVTVAVTVTDENISGSTGGIEEIDGVDPSAFDVTSAQSDTGTCTTSAGAIRCPLGGTMFPGNQIGNTIVLVAKTPGTFQLSAHSIGGGGGSTTVTLSLTVVATTADVSVKVPATALAPKLGGKVRAGILILNSGPLSENSTSLTLTIPPNVKLLSAIAQAGTCDVKHRSCKLGGLASGAQELIVLTFQGVKPGKGQVVVHGGGDVTDPAATNNQGTIAINVPKPAK